MAYTHDKRSKSQGRERSYQMTESLTHSRIQSQTKDKQAQRHESDVKAYHTATDQKKLIFLPMIPLQLVAGALGLGAAGIGLGVIGKSMGSMRKERQFAIPTRHDVGLVHRIPGTGSGQKEKKEEKDKENEKKEEKDKENEKKEKDKEKNDKPKIEIKPVIKFEIKDNSSSSSSDSESDNSSSSNTTKKRQQGKKKEEGGK